MTALKELLANMQYDPGIIFPESACGTVRDTIYEVEENAAWLEVPKSVFMAWTGCRRTNGVDFHGPVYSIDAKQTAPWAGGRACSCTTCQEHVLPQFRPN